MINGIINALTSNTMVNLAQNTTARVATETTMKAVGRPSFILIDKDLDPKTKKYSATKELLYQLICLGVYLAVIPVVFKKGAFALAKKAYKNTKGFEHFKNSKEFLEFHKLATVGKKERLEALQNGAFKKFENRPELINIIKSDKSMTDEFALQKGVIEASSFVGSILGLAILAPEVSHHLIHPIMRGLGMEEKQPKADKKVDVKA